MVHDAIFLNVY